ncbi:MAG: thiamine pyrophosphate-dependent enzyme [Candidatus Korobacteraceae bacterium]
MTDLPHRLTVVQPPEAHPPENETSLVPNRVLRQLYATVQRFQVVAPRLPLLSGSPPAGAITAQSCLLAEITAAICARKHDRLFNTRAAARLAQGETFAELLKTAPAPSLAPDTLPSSVRDRFSPAQFAATLAFLSKLRGEECVCFVLLGDHPLDHGFRHILHVCAECRLPVLFYIETHLHLPAGKHPSPTSAHVDSGVPVITTDIHDPVALYRVTTEAIHHARFGQGATVIESIQVVAAGKRTRPVTPNDPLDFIKRYMQARGIWDNEWAEAQHRAAAEELASALAAVTG